MLKKIDKSRIFLKKEWANDVVNWMTGVYSPNGTVTIHNTATPSENGSCQFDVNVPLIYKQMKDMIAADFAARTK